MQASSGVSDGVTVAISCSLLSDVASHRAHGPAVSYPHVRATVQKISNTLRIVCYARVRFWRAFSPDELL
jgi:hypothetical protein